jgi:AcrR family transcriptional regulator
LRDEQKLVTRSRLLNATVEVIERDGYLAATIDEIAASAGVGRATFYLHFDSKAAAVRALMDSFPRRDELWTALSEIGRPTRAAVRAWLEHVVRVYDEERGYFLAVEQAAAVEPGLASVYYHTSDAYIDIAARAFGGDPHDAAVRAMILWLQLSHLCFVWRVRGVDLDDRRVMETLVDIWTDALSHGG